MKNLTERNYRILIIAAAAGLLILIISAIPHSDGRTILYRDASEDYEVSFQTEAGTRLHAYFGEEKQNIHASASDAGTAEYTVNINTADADELEELLPGIGEKKAAAIVEYRDNVGSIRSVEELIEVDGIGRALLEQIRPYCVVSGGDVG